MSSKQAPIQSGFGPITTARETLDGIDLRGKVAIVTGGYSGIGLETTLALAEAGATVIVPARTPDKARQALSNIPRVEQSRLTYSTQGPSMLLRVSSLPLVDRCTRLSITQVSWRRHWRAIAEDMSHNLPQIIWDTFT